MTQRQWSWRRAILLVMAMPLVGSVAPLAAAGPDDFVRVRVDIANVREGPGADQELLWQVRENFPLKVLARRGRWLRVEDVLDDTGWIYAPLTDGKPSVAVEVEAANVRSGPGRRHAVRFTAALGDAFLVLGHRGDWLRVEHADEGRGWVHESLVWGDVD